MAQIEWGCIVDGCLVMLTTDIAERLGAELKGSTWHGHCPAHKDDHPSLEIAEGDDGKTIMLCRAGCDIESILNASELEWKDLFAKSDQQSTDPNLWTPVGEAIAVYDYTDATGNLLFQVMRTADKQFRQRRPDSQRAGGWEWRLGDTERPLYRLPEVLSALSDGETIYVVEGEKDVESIRATGAIATTAPGGAGSWLGAHTESLQEANVVVVADRDEPGYRHARAVAKALRDGGVGSVRLTQPFEGKDATDHLTAGYTLGQLVTISTNENQPRMAQDVVHFLEGEQSFDWIVPGLLERGDRLILTGFEGGGKSTLMRQFASCIAGGLDPFKFTPTEPVKALYVDCENGERLVRRKFQELMDVYEKHHGPYPEGQLYVVTRPGGMDLMTDDADWLMEQVQAFQPGVVMIGPLYNLQNEDINAESSTKHVASLLRRVAVEGNCALIAEAHAGKSESSGGKRHLRPIGSSVWLRWPEFGYGLDPIKGSNEVYFSPWRGARDERNWPNVLAWNDEPWHWRGVFYGKQKDTGTPDALTRILRG